MTAHSQEALSSSWVSRTRAPVSRLITPTDWPGPPGCPFGSAARCQVVPSTVNCSPGLAFPAASSSGADPLRKRAVGYSTGVHNGEGSFYEVSGGWRAYVRDGSGHLGTHGLSRCSTWRFANSTRTIARAGRMGFRQVGRLAGM
jgi:hypothetical protein